ncbi:tetratricopeptide repeat protein [Archangium sp.]|uniref:tetratricopeptide repeat protein n=1 Tax=Archangium sp. TaxID=1872627 RepID=UPI003899D1DA
MSLRPLLLLLWLVPMSAWAAKMPGIRLYEQGEYARASRSLKAELKNRQRSEAELARARVYLAASLLALGKKNEARQQLEQLARSTPEPQVDPAIFPPELVELEKDVRGKLQATRPPVAPDQAEKDRLAALEAERLKREQEEAERLEREREAAHKPPVVVEQRPVEPESQGPESEDEAPSTFRLRPEVVGFGDIAGQLSSGKSSVGLAAGLTVGSGLFEGSARALLGDHPAVELDAALVFGQGFFQPRVGLRGTLVPGLSSTGFGGGVVLGARLALSSRLIALVDVSAQKFSVPEGYRNFAVTGAAGVGFNLF